MTYPLKVVALSEVPNTDEKMEVIKSGFKSIDDVIGGFRTHGTYLIAGNSKSGKSSFLMNLVNTQLKRDRKCTYIDTELTRRNFISRMAGILFNQTTLALENNQELMEDWKEVCGKSLFYFGVDELQKNNEMRFDTALAYAKESVNSGAKIICFDNLTTFQTSLVQGKAGWEILSNCMTKVITFAKQHDVVCFIVVHTKANSTYKETPEGIRNLVKSGKVNEIFTDSITVVARPSVNDVYGASAKSQLNGSILIWRPLQYFNDPQLSCQADIILQEFRYAPDADCLMDYDGEKKIFTEVKPEITEEFARNLFNSKK